MEFDKLSKNERDWQIKYDQLNEFRKRHGKWPVYRGERRESEESKLGNFAYVTRKKYREGKLKHWQVDLLKLINFNLNGIEDNWFAQYEKTKKLIQTTQSVSVKMIGEDCYIWLLKNRNKFQSGTLKQEQANAFAALHLETYRSTWELRFFKLEAWVTQYHKLPTRKLARELHSWMTAQRILAKTGSLSASQLDELQRIGVYLQPKRRENERWNWQEHFDSYKAYLIQKAEGSIEKIPYHLYLWLQTQRGVYNGTIKNRKPLEKWKTDQLDAIGFKWSRKQVLAEQWAVKFDELRQFVYSKNLSDLSPIVNRHLYQWLYRQLTKYKNGTLEIYRIAQLRSIGFNFQGHGDMKLSEIEHPKSEINNDSK